MFVELIYDKRNFAGLPGAREAILNELTKRMQRIFPEAEVRVKPMMTLPAINTDARIQAGFTQYELDWIYEIEQTLKAHLKSVTH